MALALLYSVPLPFSAIVVHDGDTKDLIQDTFGEYLFSSNLGLGEAPGGLTIVDQPVGTSATENLRHNSSTSKSDAPQSSVKIQDQISNLQNQHFRDESTTRRSAQDHCSFLLSSTPLLAWAVLTAIPPSSVWSSPTQQSESPLC